ncbi:MAG TPA: winged helix-turn-helix domain-containing protein [Pyrinomonadaceae bacterium]
MNKKTYEFSDFRLDPDGKRLLRRGQTVSLQPKVFDMLVFFVERRGALISHDDLMKAVWKDTFVEESNLRFCIHALRKALGKTADGRDFVETIPKRGYRFTAEVAEESLQSLPEKAAEIPAIETPPKVVEKPRFAERKLLIGITAFLLICLLVLAFAWRQSQLQTEKKSSETKQLAVLPFEALTTLDGDFQTRLADAMIANLSKIKSLRVLPIASVRRFAGQQFDPLTVGKELQTDSVLSGSYRDEEGNVRVTVFFQRVENGETLWTETFTTRGKTDSGLEKAIAIRVARLFSLKFAPVEDEALPPDENLNAEAVQNYLAGRKIWQTRELGRRDEMIKHFEKTIELAPAWSLGYSGLAEALLSEDNYSADSAKIEQLTRRALELDDADARAHTAQAQIYFRKYWDWQAAEKSFKKAFELNPNYAHAHHEYGIFLGLERRFVEAEQEIKKAIEAEPFSPFYYASLCELYYYDHRFEEALEQCDYAVNLETDFWRARKNLFQIYVRKKMYPEMSEMVLGKLSDAEKDAHPLTKAVAAKDLRPFWQNLIDETLNSENSESNAFALSNFYLQIGDKEKAFAYLETAFKQHDDYFPTINADPAFDSIRKEKRFVELLFKAGLRK